MRSLPLALLLLCIVVWAEGRDLRSAYKTGLQHAVRNLVRALPFAQKGNTQREVDRTDEEELKLNTKDYIPGVNGGLGGGGYGGGYGSSNGGIGGGGLWDNDGWPMKRRWLPSQQKRRSEKLQLKKRDYIPGVSGGYGGGGYGGGYGGGSSSGGLWGDNSWPVKKRSGIPPQKKSTEKIDAQRDVDHTGKEELQLKIRDYIPGVSGGYGGGGYGGGYGGGSSSGGLWGDNSWPIKKRDYIPGVSGGYGGGAYGGGSSSGGLWGDDSWPVKKRSGISPQKKSTEKVDAQRDVVHTAKEELQLKIRDYIPGVNGGYGGGAYGGGSSSGGLWGDDSWPRKKRSGIPPQKKSSGKVMD